MKTSIAYLLAATAITATMATTTPPVWAKDDLVIAQESRFDTMDRYQTHQVVMTNIAPLLWDSLFERDPETGDILPGLVSDYEIVDDTTWRFTLNEGVTFSNGNPLTAESVRFTIEDWILNPELRSPVASYYEFVDRIEVEDDHTFVLHTREPYPLVLERMQGVYVYDPEYVEEAGAEEMSRVPMGSGPFEFASWSPGSELVLQKREDYWDQEDLTTFERIIFRNVPESSSRLSALLSNEVDLAFEIMPDQVSLIDNSADHETVNFSILRVSFWQFDSMGRASDTPLTDVNVRRAIWHAVDRERIIGAVMEGGGSLVDGIGHPAQTCYADGLETYDYDPERARELLTEAGYEDGFTIDLWQYIDAQNLSNQAAMSFLSEVGIEVNLRDYRGNVGGMGTMRNNGQITGIGNFAWGSAGVFDVDAIIPAWFTNDSPMDYTGDEALSEKIENARQIMDEQERCQQFREISQTIVDEAYWMPFFAQNMIHGKNSALTYTPGVDEVPRLKYATWND